MVDKVKPLKIEDSTNGTQANMFPTETDTTADYLACKGISFENSDTRLIDLNGSGVLQFTDTNGAVLLSSLAAAPTTQAVTTNITAAHNKIYLVTTSSARTITLPAAALDTQFYIKDATGSANTNNITIARAASESIDGVAASYIIDSNLASVLLVCDGTNWFVL